MFRFLRKKKTEELPTASEIDPSGVEPKFIEFAGIILQAAGLDKMPADFRQEQLRTIGAQVQQRVSEEVLSKVPDSAAKELEAAVESGGPAAMSAVLHKHVPDMDEITEASMRQFMKEYVEGAEKLKNSV